MFPHCPAHPQGHGGSSLIAIQGATKGAFQASTGRSRGRGRISSDRLSREAGSIAIRPPLDHEIFDLLDVKQGEQGLAAVLGDEQFLDPAGVKFANGRMSSLFRRPSTGPILG